MNLDERIARFRELIAKRDEVDREIVELLGDEPLQVSQHRGRQSKYEKRAARKKGPHCSICGKSGHNAMTCPQGKGLHPNNPKGGNERGPRKPSLCDECGTAGKRHFKTCSRSGKPRPPAEDVPEEPVNEGPPEDATLESDARHDVEEGSELRSIGTAPAGYRQKKIYRLLKDGHDDDFTASEVGCSPRIVAFYRAQMVKRGEL